MAGVEEALHHQRIAAAMTLFYVLRIVVEHLRPDRKRDYPPLPKNRRPRFQIDPELADVGRQNPDGSAGSFDTCFLPILGSNDGSNLSTPTWQTSAYGRSAGPSLDQHSDQH